VSNVDAGCLVRYQPSRVYFTPLVTYNVDQVEIQVLASVCVEYTRIYVHGYVDKYTRAECRRVDGNPRSRPLCPR
jgi:hypothetical protein